MSKGTKPPKQEERKTKHLKQVVETVGPMGIANLIDRTKNQERIDSFNKKVFGIPPRDRSHKK